MVRLILGVFAVGMSFGSLLACIYQQRQIEYLRREVELRPLPDPDPPIEEELNSSAEEPFYGYKIR